MQKWRDREIPADAAMGGPKEPRSTVLTPEEAAIIVALRRHTLLPLDDCLYGLQPTILRLTRSSLHRCLERHGIGRLPEVEGDEPEKKRCAQYPIGYFHMEAAQFLQDLGAAVPSRIQHRPDRQRHPVHQTRRSSATTTTAMSS